MTINTKVEETYNIVFNVRGVETEYNDDAAKIKVEEKKDIFTRIFNYIESYFAMLVALLIVATASIGFPFYLIPVSLCMLGTFLFYVYTQAG